MNHSYIAVALIFILVSSLGCSIVHANERRFTYAYETSVLPPGVREIEVWNTYNTGRSSFYRHLDQSIEFEVGVVPGVMTALYLNVGTEAAAAHGGVMAISHSFSVANEWKFKFTDRSADVIGSGLYAEAAVGVDRIGLETKVLLDKQLGGTLFALNLVGEYELNSGLIGGTETTTSETTLEASFGISQTVTKRFHVGIELFNTNNLSAGMWNTSVLYAGPVVSYTADTWWSTITIMPQLSDLRSASSSTLELTDHEKLQARLLVSFHL